jgi:N-succinyldiaminopimelate aminotransferase
MLSERLERLGEFPFRRLAALLAVAGPPGREPVLDLALGEPQHQPPALLAETVAAHAQLWNRYPPIDGTPAFRRAATDWLRRRYDLPAEALDPDRHVLPLAGTKEGLFMAAALASGAVQGGVPAVLMPNPVYAVYYGAAVMAGAEPVLLPATAATGFLPDLDALEPGLLDRTALFYLCSPANPQGAAADLAYLRRLIGLARRHDFLLALDECYAELWHREPPPGGLQAAWQLGPGFRHLLVFHSLSKRSNAAGLRSGFVAGDPEVLRRFLRLRAYGAAVQPLPLMAAATALWQDEAHVAANRALYRAKFDLAEARLAGRLGFYRPAAGFFLWLEVGDGEAAAVKLWREAGLKVLPGLYLGSAGADGSNPGAPFLRLALVHEQAVVATALDRLLEVLG